MRMDQTFEERLEKVQAIIERIESGEYSLEEAVNQYEAGIRSLNELEKDLGEMKRRITVLQQASVESSEEIPLEEQA